MTLNQSEMFEEEEQFKQLRLASGRDSKTRSAITLKCFRKLFDIYTEMLKLNAKDTYALKQVYRLCCQWEPIFSTKQEKEELFALYNHVFCELKFKDPDWFRALVVKAAICPDYTYGDDKTTEAESARSIIYTECKRMASDAVEYFQNMEAGVEAACFFADNAIWEFARCSKDSTKQIWAREALQGFNTAVQIICGNEDKKIDALVGLWRLTGEKEHIERAMRINAAEVYRASFGRLGAKGA
jgi:hypothetical protein